MKTFNLLLVMFCFVSNSYSQNTKILVFDLVNETIDSITNIPVDPASQSDFTDFQIGNIDDDIEALNETPPTTNVFLNSQFTMKRKVASDYNLNSYPIRTSVKIYYVENDTMKSLCSGSMISRKHVLTSAYCFSEPGSNTMIYDSIYVCPVFDNGNFNPNFNCSFINKVYIEKDYSPWYGQIGVLEVDEPIGESTGWLGIGFDDSGAIFSDNSFYKFTYPIKPIPDIDNFPYNGDTLYYNYGNVNYTELIEPVVNISNGRGVIGEGGSTIIHVENDETYTAYGVLSFSTNLLHTIFDNEMFQIVKYIIQDDITLANSESNNDLQIKVFPNPTNGNIKISNLPKNQSFEVSLFDTSGRLIYVNSNYGGSEAIELSNYSNGTYYLGIKNSNFSIFRKVIKSGI